MTSPKKFLLILLVAIVVAALVFGKQIKRALSITTAGVGEPVVEDLAVNIPILPGDQTLGNPGAKLWIVEFINLGDPLSRATHAKLAAFAKARPKDARLIWKHLPEKRLWSGDSLPAHLAAACAGEQDRFWPWVEEFIGQKAPAGEEGFLAIARSLKLNESNFAACLKNQNTVAKINADLSAAALLNLRSAPAVFANNKKIAVREDLDLIKILETLITP